MELHQLRYALAVADHGTFTAAAEASFVAQPSLSHAVRTLERELGAPLFHRLGRHIALTAAVVGLDAGHLDLVALPTLAVDPITPLVGAFRTAHPGVTVRLAHPEGTTELVELIRSGSSEIGVTELPVDAERIATHPLGRQELVAVLPPGSPRPRRLELAALARRPLVTQRRGTSTRDAVDAALATVGAEATVAVETDQREAIVPLVLAGAGAAVVPRPMATLAQRDGAVVAPLRPPLWRQLGLIHRDAPLSPAAQAFVTLAGER
jgi:DNA-binding transcriptional LysR family regulator